MEWILAMMNLNINKNAMKFLNNLQSKQFTQVTKSMLALLINTRPHDCKHLSYHPGCFRIDCGEYRICYQINGNVVEVITVGSRNDDSVYKIFKRKNH